MKNSTPLIIVGAFVLLLMLTSAKATGQESPGGTDCGGGTGPADVDYRPQGSLPRGLRNNNPGNLKRSNSPWKGKVSYSESTDATFEQFCTVKYGIRAMMKLLQNYHTDGRDTVRLIISRWAPADSGEGNPTSTYINNVAGYLGVSPDAPLAWNYNNAANLTIGMAAFENGRTDAVTPAQTKQVWNEFFA